MKHEQRDKEYKQKVPTELKSDAFQAKQGVQTQL